MKLFGSNSRKILSEKILDDETYNVEANQDGEKKLFNENDSF